MCVLLDECVNPRLRRSFACHDVTVLKLARNNLDVFVTLDRGFAHQHNLNKLTFGIVIIHVPENTLEFYKPIFKEIRRAIETIRAGEVIHVVSPLQGH